MDHSYLLYFSLQLVHSHSFFVLTIFVHAGSSSFNYHWIISGIWPLQPITNIKNSSDNHTDLLPNQNYYNTKWYWLPSLGHKKSDDPQYLGPRE